MKANLYARLSDFHSGNVTEGSEDSRQSRRVPAGGEMRTCPSEAALLQSHFKKKSPRRGFIFWPCHFFPVNQYVPNKIRQRLNSHMTAARILNMMFPSIVRLQF